jgi:hypothetical protein
MGYTVTIFIKQNRFGSDQRFEQTHRFYLIVTYEYERCRYKEVFGARVSSKKRRGLFFEKVVKNHCKRCITREA